MIVDEEEDIYDFLEHHGVRGMKWGVRRASGGSSSGVSKPAKKSKPPLTKEQKQIRRNKVIGYAMVGIGAALAAKMLHGQMKTMKARDAAKIYNAKKNIKIAQQVNDVISMNTGVRMSEVRTGFKVGPSSTVRSGFKVGKSGVAEATKATKSVVEEVLSRR